MDGGDDGGTAPEPDFKIKGAASRQSTISTTDDCLICLQAITQRGIAVPCNHLSFDFGCLALWLNERPACPLCQAPVTAVQYDWRGPNDYQTFVVQSRSNDARHLRRIRVPQLSNGVPSIDPALERRRRIYRDELYSLHIGSNRHSRYIDFTPTIYIASKPLQSRTRAFLRRELQVFTFLEIPSPPRGGSTAFLIEFIVAILKTSDPKAADGHAVDLLTEFLGRENAQLLLHELIAWLRSPYARLEEWDGVVQYADGRTMKP